MKNLKIFLALIAITTIISCKKDINEQLPPLPPTIYPNFSQLKVGNYWIYQQFDIDTSGNATPKNIYDSCYVVKDTIINSRTYFKVFRPYLLSNYNYSFLRDSLHYIVNFKGGILFSSQDFSTVFSSNYILAGPNDTVCQIIEKMADKDTMVVTPAGTFKTSNARVTYSMYPNWSFAGNPRYIHTRYAKNVGIVIETLPFYSSNPNYVERRLVRYLVN